MATFTFDTTIPAANNAPRNDQPGMQQNNASTSGIVAVDHVGFNVPNGGYHKTVHQPSQTIGGQSAWNPVTSSGVPGAIGATKITGVQQTFSMLYTPDTAGGAADTQLFSMTGQGGISQLTGNLSSSDGWVWMGGILIQWGVVSQSFSSGSTTGTVIFKNRVAGAIPFPNNCFVVTGNPLVSFSTLPTSQASINIRQSTLSNTQFNYQFYTNSSSYIGFYWIAIGN